MFLIMARLPRVVVVDVPHHITQRGNARQVVFAADADRLAYLALLRHSADLHQLSLLGYCLMSNHVHLVAIPRTSAALAQTLKQAHGRYAACWNARQARSGHVWQRRYYSCPLDDAHLWAALRYTERNPVRAGMAAAADQWPWSSARAHCEGHVGDELIDIQIWRQRWSAPEWRRYLDAPESAEEVGVLGNVPTPAGRWERLRLSPLWNS